VKFFCGFRGRQAHFLVSLAASPLDFARAATRRAIVLQREPARRVTYLRPWIHVLIEHLFFYMLTNTTLDRHGFGMLSGSLAKSGPLDFGTKNNFLHFLSVKRV